jgi:hypothetical protein
VSRREAQFALLIALALVTAGTVWMFGPYGLVGGGLLLAVLVLFVIDVKEPDGEAVAQPARPGLRRTQPVQHQPVRR